MTKTKHMPPRGEVNPADTWDLTPLFKNDAAWERAFAKLTGQVEGFLQFQGRLGTSARVLREFCDFQVQFEKAAERIASYAHLKTMEDLGDSTYQALIARFMHMAMHANEAASFFAPEVRAIPKKSMAAFLDAPELAPYRFQLERLLRYRPHILSLKEERLLAMQGEVAGTASRVFEQLNDADLKFGFVTNERGEKVELSQGSFRVLLESPKRAVRKNAFDRFYKVYADHANAMAATLSSSVLQDVYQARARNYPSALEAALFDDRVPIAVYDNLIAAVHDHLDTVHRYLELRRKALGIRDIHMYDTYVPIVQEAKTNTSYDAAVDTIRAALEPLGADYCRVLEKGLRDGRWVDRYENVGNRSGACSAGGYTGPPYILMNYQADVLDSVFTLAHEAGHSMH
ncbi:MAG: oligoendopeptidase, partial [Candidatus Hydrogenedentes bacterium]|nr:oligoendopeptidase [Candidatus Hydrogenedentota bacterium]